MEDSYSYWKHPWQKSVCLVNAALQLLLLGGTIRDYRRLAGAGILSPAAREAYAAKAGLLCCLFSAVFALSAAAVVIGGFCRSRRSARRAEGWTLLGLGAAWAAAGAALSLWDRANTRWVWAGCLALFLALGAWLLWKKPSEDSPKNAGDSVLDGPQGKQNQ